MATSFVCPVCKTSHPKWAARCSSCFAWGLVQGPDTTELPPPSIEIDDEDEQGDGQDQDDESVPIPLSRVIETEHERDLTNLPPLDYVLGGGLVVGSVVMLASSRGAGKSTATLQLMQGLGHRCLYVTGEETRGQLAATAKRIGVTSSKIYLMRERHLGKIFERARAMRARAVAIDSIQKMLCEDVVGRHGSASQLKECTDRLVEFGKSTMTTLWLIAHVTRDGNAAGPMTIEHDVDVLLELERGPGLEGRERVLKCLGKNRFGPDSNVGRFEMTEGGLVPVDGDGWSEPL